MITWLGSHARINLFEIWVSGNIGAYLFISNIWTLSQLWGSGEVHNKVFKNSRLKQENFESERRGEGGHWVPSTGAISLMAYVALESPTVESSLYSCCNKSSLISGPTLIDSMPWNKDTIHWFIPFKCYMHNKRRDEMVTAIPPCFLPDPFSCLLKPAKGPHMYCKDHYFVILGLEW